MVGEADIRDELAHGHAVDVAEDRDQIVGGASPHAVIDERRGARCDRKRFGRAGWLGGCVDWRRSGRLAGRHARLDARVVTAAAKEETHSGNRSQAR